MPIYEYECARCGHRFEMMQKFDDPPRKRCPQCRGKVERLISSPAIRFKGSGWYVTDYAKKGRADDKGPEERAESGDKKAQPEDGKKKKKKDDSD